MSEKKKFVPDEPLKPLPPPGPRNDVLGAFYALVEWKTDLYNALVENDPYLTIDEDLSLAGDLQKIYDWLNDVIDQYNEGDDRDLLDGWIAFLLIWGKVCGEIEKYTTVRRVEKGMSGTILSRENAHNLSLDEILHRFPLDRASRLAADVASDKQKNQQRDRQLKDARRQKGAKSREALEPYFQRIDEAADNGEKKSAAIDEEWEKAKRDKKYVGGSAAFLSAYYKWRKKNLRCDTK